MHRCAGELVPGDVRSLFQAWSDRDQHSLALVNEACLRFFAGLSVGETAEVLHVSSITVMCEWKSARAWFHRELADPTANGH